VHLLDEPGESRLLSEGIPHRIDVELGQPAVAGVNAIAPPSRDFDGLGDGFVGPAGAMTVTVVSPDPSGDVGPNHYVEAVNAQLAVFDKTGVPILGPVPVNTLWSGFGGDCETNNDGRATVLYDPTPAYLLSLGTDSASLDLRTLAVDWQNPASSALDAPLTLPVGAWVMIRGYKSFAGVTLIGQY